MRYHIAKWLVSLAFRLCQPHKYGWSESTFQAAWDMIFLAYGKRGITVLMTWRMYDRDTNKIRALDALYGEESLRLEGTVHED